VTKRALIDFDDLMRHLMYVGVGILVGWTLASMVGVLSGRYTIEPQATLRFLLAVLVVVFARRTYWELMEWRWQRRSADDRYGFSSPLWETPRSTERPAGVTDPEQAPQ
jgi:steroid 5-alpha reductase family enzyme